MDKNQFIKIMNMHKEQDKLVDYYQDLINFDNPLIDFGYRMFDMCLKTNFNSNQIDIIDWYLYEKDSSYGIKNVLRNEKGEEIDLSSPEKLWDYINE